MNSAERFALVVVVMWVGLMLFIIGLAFGENQTFTPVHVNCDLAYYICDDEGR